ncbi:MULE domain-containing protein, partial [Aphis craccivora]
MSSDALKRSCLLEHFNINYATKRDTNDAVSVELWVTEMLSYREDCPVLYYKNQGANDSILDSEDFGLILMTHFQKQLIVKFGNEKICIDGTHGTNAYDIQLYTLMIIDKFGSGCPVAFCFSNRSDERIFQLFFDVVKSKVGHIQSIVFMSDDAPAFYNVWVNVMGPATHKLLLKKHLAKLSKNHISKPSINETNAIVRSKSGNIGDYHSQMNVEVFRSWFIEMLQSLEEACVIVMDNAAYHSMLVDNFPKSNARKSDIQEWMPKKNITFSSLETVAELHERVKLLLPTQKKYELDEVALKMGH